MRKGQRIKELEKENERLQAEVTRLTDKLEVLQKVEDLGATLAATSGNFITNDSLAPRLRMEGAAMLVDDYYGGKVFEHEATDLTVLDSNGKATYHKTKQAPDKGFSYKLERPTQS